MFGLFRKKEKAHPVTDLVWMSDKAKKQGLFNLLEKTPDAVLYAWFDETAKDFENFLKSRGIRIKVNLQRKLFGNIAAGKTVILLEHYPLYKAEQEFLSSLQASGIIILSSIDEPLLKQFGGDRISFLMRAMGSREDEVISHNMVTLSLQKAQKKLEKKIQYDQAAGSMSEWFQRNVPV